MGATEPLAIDQLDALDAPSGLLLSTEAHWNQSEADWRFFLEKGIVFGVRDRGGRLVATAALLPYATTDAWISMVLVAASWRRRGLATRLVDRCLALGSWLSRYYILCAQGSAVLRQWKHRPRSFFGREKLMRALDFSSGKSFFQMQIKTNQRER